MIVETCRAFKSVGVHVLMIIYSSSVQGHRAMGLRAALEGARRILLGHPTSEFDGDGILLAQGASKGGRQGEVARRAKVLTRNDPRKGRSKPRGRVGGRKERKREGIRIGVRFIRRIRDRSL